MSEWTGIHSMESSGVVSNVASNVASLIYESNLRNIFKSFHNCLHVINLGITQEMYKYIVLLPVKLYIIKLFLALLNLHT